VKIYLSIGTKLRNCLSGFCIDCMHVGTHGIKNALISLTIAPIRHAAIIVHIEMCSLISFNAVKWRIAPFFFSCSSIQRKQLKLW
jgi:hypothetical protein